MTTASLRSNVKHTVAHLTRQPVFDLKLNTVGYELLFLEEAAQVSAAGATTRATSLVLADMLAEFGLETVVGNLPAWVNFTVEYLAEKLPIPIGPSSLVIQVQKDAATNDEALERLFELRNQNYRIVFDSTGHDPSLTEIVRIAHTTKIDIHRRDMEEIHRDVATYSSGSSMLLAKRVARMSDFDACHRLGFKLFQGSFLSQPEEIRQPRVPTQRLTMMHLMSELYATDPSIDRIRNLVQQDVALSYRLLKWLNSSLFALPHQVESIQHALVMLGLTRLRNLVCLLVLSRIDDKPSELVTTCLMRARIGERLAHYFGVQGETMFTVGLLSLLDVLVEMPMSQVLETMPLAPELRDAILERKGACGRLLTGIEAHERGDWAGVESAGLDLSVLTPAWVDAAVWVRQIRSMTRNTLPNSTR